MTVEADIFAALKDLVGNRVYRDLAPDKVTTLPRITFQQVGGGAVNFLDPTVPSKKNGRFQVNCWDGDRDAVAGLSRQVEDALRVASGLQTTVLGEPIAVFEQETMLYGTIQDFSFWFET